MFRHRDRDALFRKPGCNRPRGEEVPARLGLIRSLGSNDCGQVRNLSLLGTSSL